MSEHSLGPWRACHDGECKCGFIWSADHETHVASAHGPGALGADWYGSDIVCNHETQKANARLIAAAPELLAAAAKLEEAETFHANCEECEGEGVPELCEACFPLFDEARCMRRLAIAKAENHS